MMVNKIYHAKLSYNGLIQKWWLHALKACYKLNYNDIYDYSSEEDELNAMSMLV
jgi:hypothetical protein